MLTQKTLVAVSLALAALAGSASAQEAEPCPLSDGQAPVAAPAVTAQQIESGEGSLETFALSAARELRRGTHTLHLRCLFQQDGGPWHSGSTYLVSLTLDGRVFIHARDMSLSGRLLDPAIYRAVLGALGVGRGNDLVARLTAVAAEGRRWVVRRPRCFRLRHCLLLARLRETDRAARGARP